MVHDDVISQPSKTTNTGFRMMFHFIYKSISKILLKIKSADAIYRISELNSLLREQFVDSVPVDFSIIFQCCVTHNKLLEQTWPQ